VVCIDHFAILRFVLVDCPSEEVLFVYYTELFGLQKNMKAVISVPVTVHVKTSISSCIFFYILIYRWCVSVYMYTY